MKSYIISGLLEGTKVMAFFALVSVVWASIIHASTLIEISPGWAMLVLFTIAIYGMNIAVQKSKHEAVLAQEKNKESINGGAE